MPAARCELDHVVPFPEGSTSAQNLRAECTAHHHLKHTAAVHLEALPGDGSRWTMPTGHTYDSHPPPVGLVWDVGPDAEPSVEEPWWADWRHDEPLCRTG